MKIKVERIDNFFDCLENRSGTTAGELVRIHITCGCGEERYFNSGFEGSLNCPCGVEVEVEKEEML